MKDNIIVKKSFNFAVKIVECYKELSNDSKEYILSKQLLKAGTSIGANVREAVQAQSKKDFISKMSVALKEAYESEYWLDLLLTTKFMDDIVFNELDVELKEITKILCSIVKSAKENA